MLELIISALITLLPDYLYRRYAQGKRFGYEINLYNFWYELRWGITACGALTIALITVIFFFHPNTEHVISIYRTVTIMGDRSGRVEEVYVGNNQFVKEGEPIFRLDTSRQRAAVETARRQIAEVDASMVKAKVELDVARGDITAATGDLREAEDELARNLGVYERNPNLVSELDIEQLRATVKSRQGSLDAAEAQLEVLQTQVELLLPAQRASTEAALAQAEVEIEQSTIFAGTDGTLTQFLLKPGDITNPMLRAAGILVPESTARGALQAGFGQIAAQILYVGMVTEVTCPSLPLTVIPMVITEIQDAIPAGQLRPTDQLVELTERVRPGALVARLEPLFEDNPADAIPPGSVCVAVAYSNHAPAIAAGEIKGFDAFLWTAVDGMGIANAFVIRAQALLLPIFAIVFSG